MKELAKTYSPSEFEERIYQNWCDKKYFTPVIDRSKPHFSIVIPPPNITGQLHMGHALDNTLQDILIRYKRMNGYCTLWLPGTDHASIATEAKIVEAMRKEGVTKDDIGRDGFLERAWAWKEQYGGRIISQLKKLGSSCDWSRERFTMDEGCSEAVKEVFVRLYNKGLIYRGERIINWCPHCLTSISDAEVEYEEQSGHFWHIKYPLSDGSGYLEFATTRPETMLGDTAVAVNPKDERYTHLIGKTLIIPLVNREIPIIADEYVEMDFGTGVVKITPAHDPNDFEVGRRHNLPIINVMTDDAKITEDYPAYAGMDRFEARKAIVADLEKLGYLIKVEDYAHNVGTCYRCGTTVEPRVSLQWFVAMEELAKPAIESVRSGEIKFVPERFDKNYFHWMENIRDWCISRQLWWGHRIPAFYCDDCGEIVVTKEKTAKCPKCGKEMRQDPDTLDTWFSSALWPFSTLGWPNETEDLKYFYPTNTLVTGYDIITFWVSRMIFSGLEYMGEKPFDTVLIHGLVRDALGRKMSKSLGNGIDPLLIIEKYGADALRFALATGNSPGNDMRFSDEKIESARNFVNKLWNASRFVMMNVDIDKVSLPSSDKLGLADKWILSKLNALIKNVRAQIESYELGIALDELYKFVWDVFCSWYIELSKPAFMAKGSEQNEVSQNVIIYVLENILKLLHPFIPFITEEIYQSLPHFEDCESIMISTYPDVNDEFNFSAECEMMEKIISVIDAVRTRRSEMNVPPSKKAKIFIATQHKDAFTPDTYDFFKALASASDVEVVDEYSSEGAVQIITHAGTAYIPMAEMVDTEKEKARLNAELTKVQGEIDRLVKKLSNEEFVKKAPEKVVNLEKEKLAKYESTKQGILDALASL